MKTLVISAIIAMTSLVNVVSAAAVNRTDNFAYNTETNDGRVETQTVFKVENQKFLHRHLKYNYIYDNSGRISQKEVAKEISTMSSGSEGNSYSVLKVI